ncbi:MAG: signal peptidase II [Deltaproteobacteria bacterium]|nr:signal peptidase II [Deltaproteobacteria bacterium]
MLIAGGVVALDQMTKALVLKTMALYHSIPVISGFFNLTHIRNPGGAFGFMARQGPGVRAFLFLAVSFLAIILLFYLYRKIPRSYQWLSAGLALIMGGAMGNLIDRIRFGEVVDFLDFYAGAYHWPAFNVADSAVTVGILVLLIHMVLGKLPE